MQDLLLSTQVEVLCKASQEMFGCIKPSLNVSEACSLMGVSRSTMYRTGLIEKLRFVDGYTNIARIAAWQIGGLENARD